MVVDATVIFANKALLTQDREWTTLSLAHMPDVGRVMTEAKGCGQCLNVGL